MNWKKKLRNDWGRLDLTSKVLTDFTIGAGSYGIAASAVDKNELLPTYLRITDIYDDGTLNFEGLKSVDDPKSDNYKLEPNDIVFARTGGSTGRNYFYDGEDGEFIYAGFLIKFSIDPEKCNPKFIKYYCQSQEYKEWVQSFNTGSTRGNINAKTFGNMPLPYVSRKQQDLIVKTLSALDDKIAENKKINHQLEQIAKAIFYEKFGNQVPNGLLGDLASVSSGKRPPIKVSERTATEDIPILGAASIMGYTSKSLYSEKILVTGRVGTHGIIQRYNRPCWPSDNALVLKSDDYELVYQNLLSIDFSSMNRGSTQPLITQTDLKNVAIYIPTQIELSDFEDTVGTIMQQYESNIVANESLVQLRDSLLPKLMSGEISVTD
ncbi:restriction endonuclease subunit S [Leuconostoc citreum]